MSERIYKLLNGSELLVSEEVMGVRQTPEGMPITVDGDYVIDDVLALVDRLRKEVEGLEASKEIEIECHVQSCLDYQAQIQALNDEQDLLRRELEESRQHKMINWRKNDPTDRNIESHVPHLVYDGDKGVMIAVRARNLEGDGYVWIGWGGYLVNKVTFWAPTDLPGEDEAE